MVEALPSAQLQRQKAKSATPIAVVSLMPNLEHFSNSIFDKKTKVFLTKKLEYFWQTTKVFWKKRFSLGWLWPSDINFLPSPQLFGPQKMLWYSDHDYCRCSLWFQGLGPVPPNFAIFLTIFSLCKRRKVTSLKKFCNTLFEGFP